MLDPASLVKGLAPRLPVPGSLVGRGEREPGMHCLHRQHGLNARLSRSLLAFCVEGAGYETGLVTCCGSAASVVILPLQSTRFHCEVGELENLPNTIISLLKYFQIAWLMQN